MAKRKDRAEIVMQECWLKAYRAGRCEINFEDEKGAERSRFALYRAAREAREGNASKELEEAVTSCILSKEGTKVVILRRDTLKEVAAMAKAAGLDLASMEVPKTELEREVEESARRLQERLKENG